MTSRLDLEPGAKAAQIGVRYQVDALLGRGGMATVYRVTDAATERRMALKQLALPQEPSRRAETVALFEREFHALAQLSHPRVIEVYDYGVDETGPYYTMELLDGGDLRARAPLPVATGVHLAQRRLLVARADPLAPPGAPRRQPRQHLVHPRRRGQAHRLRRAGADGRGDVDRRHAGVRRAGGRAAIGARRPHGSLLVRRDAVLRADGAPAVSGAELLAARGALDAAPVPAPSTLVADVPEALDALVMSLLCAEPAMRPRGAFEVMQRLSAIAGIERDEPLSVSQAYLSTPVIVGRDPRDDGPARRMTSASPAAVAARS